MSVDRQALLQSLLGELGAAVPAAAHRATPETNETNVTDGAGGVAVPELIRTWLLAASQRGEAPSRADIDAVCRQIDVRKRLSTRYGPGWTTLPPEEPVPGAVVVGAAAVLLAMAQTTGATGDRWDLKLVNSALKALDLDPVGPQVPAVRAWAIELLDRAAPAGAS